MFYKLLVTVNSIVGKNSLIQHQINKRFILIFWGIGDLSKKYFNYQFMSNNQSENCVGIYSRMYHLVQTT